MEEKDINRRGKGGKEVEWLVVKTRNAKHTIFPTISDTVRAA
jgi:hypothetical protein